MLRIKLIKSTIANTPRNRATVKALGLNKVNSSVVQPDNPQIRGMIHHVKHLLEVTVVDDSQAKPKTSPKAAKPAVAVAEPKAESKPAAPKAAKPKTAPKAKKAEGEEN